MSGVRDVDAVHDLMVGFALGNGMRRGNADTDMSDETTTAAITTGRNDATGRYELRLDGALASFVEFHDDGATVTFPHTFTEPPFRGRGLAEQVVGFAVDDVRAAGRQIVAQCWFVAQYLAEHPEPA